MSNRDGAARAIAILTAGLIDDETTPLDDDEFFMSLIGETDEEILETVSALTGIGLAAMSVAAPGLEAQWLQSLGRNIDKLPGN